MTDMFLLSFWPPAESSYKIKISSVNSSLTKYSFWQLYNNEANYLSF